jgi:hypothetical protein
MIVGLFSFVGKALGSVAKFIPGVGQIVNAVEMAGSVLGMKSGGSAGKMAAIQRVGPDIARGNATQSSPGGYGKMAGLHHSLMSARALRASPVMPGGSVATARGPVAAKGGRPPGRFGGGFGKRRKRSAVSAARKLTRKRKSGGGAKRKLKFGSPAWRAKYMKKRR